jgi:hypothetical protein
MLFVNHIKKMGDGYIRGSVVDKEKDMKDMNYELQYMVLQTNSKI